MWISVDIGILEHPKLQRTAKELGISQVVCLGHLTALWIFCYKSAPDGDLSSYDPEDIAIASGWDGDAQKFYDVLMARHWLDKDDNGIYAHDWLGHAGKYLKRNRQSYDSRRRMRDTSATDDSQTHVQDNTVQDKPDKTKKQEPMPEIPDYINAETWAAFMDVRKKARAVNSPFAIRLLLKDLANFKNECQDPNAVIEQSIRNGWRGLFRLKDQPASPNAQPKPAHRNIEDCSYVPVGEA